MKHLLLSVFLSMLCSCPVSAQWVQIGLPDRGIGEIAVGSSGLYAITTDSGSVFRSINGGTHWVQINQAHGTHIAVARDGNTFMSKSVVSHSVCDSLCWSTDGGNSWNGLPYPLADETRSGKYQARTISIAVGPNGWVFWGGFIQSLMQVVTSSAMSTDNGKKWTGLPAYDWSGLPGGGAGFAINGHSLMSYGYSLGARGTGYVICLSTDGGRTWEVRSNRAIHTECMIAWCSNGNLMAIGPWWSSGLFLSADTGSSSSQISTLFPSALLALPQGGVLVSTDTTGVYLFSDNGDSLGTLNEGLTDHHIHRFALDSSGYVYVGTNNGIWRRPLTEIGPPTGIARTVAMPNTFHLEQNYPNPFNPVTNIQFTIVKRQLTILRVYDVLGSKMATLVNEVKEPGTYTVQFDARLPGGQGSNLASGVYFYRLQAEGLVQTRKLVVLK